MKISSWPWLEAVHTSSSRSSSRRLLRRHTVLLPTIPQVCAVHSFLPAFSRLRSRHQPMASDRLREQGPEPAFGGELLNPPAAAATTTSIPPRHEIRRNGFRESVAWLFFDEAFPPRYCSTGASSQLHCPGHVTTCIDTPSSTVSMPRCRRRAQPLVQHNVILPWWQLLFVVACRLAFGYHGIRGACQRAC